MKKSKEIIAILNSTTSDCVQTNGFTLLLRQKYRVWRPKPEKKKTKTVKFKFASCSVHKVTCINRFFFRAGSRSHNAVKNTADERGRPEPKSLDIPIRLLKHERFSLHGNS